MQASGNVVVKIVQTRDPDRYKRAKREMNLFRMFHKHKRICTMMSSRALDAANGLPGRCICVFQYFKLGTVQILLETAHPEFTEPSAATRCLRFKHAVAMTKDVLEGLEYMHGMNIVHRDIKPANICVEIEPSTTEPRFTIIDLGAAVATQTASKTPDHSASAANFTGMFTSVLGAKLPLGTVPFMSPEHIDEFGAVDGRSDLFSLGVTMYTCLCGRFPFVQPRTGYNINHLAQKLIRAYASAAEAAPLKLPSCGAHTGAMVKVIHKCLRKEPKERYQSAEAMRKHIERIDRCRVQGEVIDIVIEISMHA